MTQQEVLKKKFYTAKEVSDILGFHIITIYRLIKQGKIKAFRFNREWRISKDEVERWKS